MPKVEYVISQL